MNNCDLFMLMTSILVVPLSIMMGIIMFINIIDEIQSFKLRKLERNNRLQELRQLERLYAHR